MYDKEMLISKKEQHNLSLLKKKPQNHVYDIFVLLLLHEENVGLICLVLEATASEGTRFRWRSS